MALSVQVHRIVKEKKGHGEYIPAHTHPFYHCVYVISGRGRIRIGTETVDARRGLFLRIAPQVEHAIFGEEAMQSFDIKFSAKGEFLDAVNALLFFHHVQRGHRLLSRPVSGGEKGGSGQRADAGL